MIFAFYISLLDGWMDYSNGWWCADSRLLLFTLAECMGRTVTTIVYMLFWNVSFDFYNNRWGVRQSFVDIPTGFWKRSGVGDGFSEMKRICGTNRGTVVVTTERQSRQQRLTRKRNGNGVTCDGWISPGGVLYGFHHHHLLGTGSTTSSMLCMTYVPLEHFLAICSAFLEYTASLLFSILVGQLY